MLAILYGDKLPQNLEKLNRITQDMKDLFKNAGVENMGDLPKTGAERQKFAKLFGEFNDHLAAATLQGFTWEEQSYTFEREGEEGEPFVVESAMDETMFLTLAKRYQELAKEADQQSPDKEGSNIDYVPYDLQGYLTEIDTGKLTLTI